MQPTNVVSPISGTKSGIVDYCTMGGDGQGDKGTTEHTRVTVMQDDDALFVLLRYGTCEVEFLPFQRSIKTPKVLLVSKPAKTRSKKNERKREKKD